MQILFVTSEAVPFIKTGGLADVAGSLPKALKAQGADVRVILPKYGDIPESFKDQMYTVHTDSVYVNWRQQYCGIEELEYDGVTYYFVDNQFYFNRQGLYGYGDDAERFAFFCRGVLEALPKLNFQPDVIHCHDWHTGLVPVFLEANYKQYEFYHNMRTMFTIHNLKYQGVFGREVLSDILNLGPEHYQTEALEFNDAISFMKGGIAYSNSITTVSPTYAEEIQTHYFGEGLDGLLRKRSGDLHGILNGIDYDVYDPMTDPHLEIHYRGAMNKKKLNKTMLQAQMGLPVNGNIPMISIVTRLVEQKGLDLIHRVLEDILAEDVQLVVLGTGQSYYEALFREAAHRHPEKLSAHIYFSEEMARKVYASSDLFLMPSLFEPCGIGQLIAMRYRTVPIVRETGGLKDTVQAYNPVDGTGTGFTFHDYNAHEMLYAIQRGVRAYGEKETWNKLIANIGKTDFSWKASAKQYMQLYRQTAAGRAGVR
ncbi:glycogen synthase [Paenibacillus swuensis]|uniref:Glycogen synthase n=1 Tax=Paenibacillus swuensis TaxID=1178515 RepID=A0A172TES9_9BACL|nr:glycogen synthase GlgA [Paenibacillus swuensis]ANE45575.1 glycogen synthase [Paenibacillus swuensis]